MACCKVQGAAGFFRWRAARCAEPPDFPAGVLQGAGSRWFSPLASCKVRGAGGCCGKCFAPRIGFWTAVAELAKRSPIPLKTNHPAKRDAARRIALVVDKYGSGVARLRYQQETGEIRSLVADLREDAAASAAMTALGVTDWLGEMDSANLAFDAAYVQRSQEMAGEPSQLLALRATALEKWQALAAHLTAHATLEPDPALAQTIAELNRLIQDYNDAATRRSGEEEPAADPTPAAPAAPAAPIG